MKVLAVGAAGSSAGLVTAALAKRGVEVRGLVHSADKANAAKRNGASEVVIADLNDRDALTQALQGVDGVFHVIPAFVADEGATGVAMVEVAAELGIQRLVFSSVYHPSLTVLSNHRDKQPAEQALFDSDLPFVILQPSMFMAQLDGLIDAARHGAITGPYSADQKMSYVDYRDVAEVAADAFMSDRLLYGTFELSSPGMFSRNDLAHILGELLGRDVTAGATSPQLPDSMPPAMRHGLQAMMQYYNRYGFHGGNSLVLETALRRAPMTVPDYLAELLRE